MPGLMDLLTGNVPGSAQSMNMPGANLLQRAPRAAPAPTPLAAAQSSGYASAAPGDGVTFTGAPLWYAQMKEKLLQRAEALSRQEDSPYGLDPQAQRALSGEIQRLKAQANLINSPFAIPFSITGSDEPVFFTPAQLKRASEDETFAKRVYEKSTGIHGTPENDIAEFRNRIVYQIPQLDDMLDKQEAYEAQSGTAPEIINLHEAEKKLRSSQGLYKESLNKYEQVAQEAPAYVAKPSDTFPLQGGSRVNRAQAQSMINTGELSPSYFSGFFDSLNAYDKYEKAKSIYDSKIQAAKNDVQEASIPYNNAIQVAENSAYHAQGHPEGDSYLRKISTLHPASVPDSNPADINAAANAISAFEDDITAQNYQFLNDPLNIKRDSDENLFQRLNVPSATEHVLSQFGRVAPMNQLHEQARRMVQRNIGSQDESFKLSKEEIEAARNRDIAGEAKALIARGLTPTHQMLDPYVNRHNEDVIEAMRGDAQKNFLEEVLPSITGNFAASGGFHTGARQNTLHKHALKAQEQLNRDIMKLRHTGLEDAYKRAEQQNAMTLQASPLVAQAEKMQHEANLKAAHEARDTALLQKETNKEDVSAVSQFAHQQQHQAQQEINQRRAAYNEMQNEERDRLATYANIAAGIEAPTIQKYEGARSQLGAPPTPPNPYNAAGGMLGQMVAMNRLQNQNAKAGGLIKRKLAPGGLVQSPAQRYAQMMQGLPDSKYESQQAGIASELRNERVDPLTNWLQHVSSQMLSNTRGNPMENIGRGAQTAEDHMNLHRNRQIDAKLKAANVYQALDNSRHSQEKLLANFHDAEEQRSEQARHHRATEGANYAKDNAPMSEGDILDLEYKKAQIDALRGKNIPEEIQIGEKTIKPRNKTGLSPQDLSQLKTIEKNKELNESKKYGYKEMVDFLKNQREIGELPSTGTLAKYSPNVSDLSKEYERRLEKMVSGELPSGVLTNAKLAFAKGLKPTELDSPEVVEKFAKVGKEHYGDLIERDQVATDFAAYNIPPRVSFAAYDQWKKNGKEGDISEYVQTILEGASAPKYKDEISPVGKYDQIDDSRIAKRDSLRIAVANARKQMGEG
jgi:hypothetical protein